MFATTLTTEGLAGSQRRTPVQQTGKNATPASNKAKYSAAFDLLGNSSGGSGLGVSAPITAITTTAKAEIDSGALVYVGSQGSLSVTAGDTNFFVILAQSGGQAKTMGFSGTVSVLDVTATTTAQIQSGVTVTGGGAVLVVATDDSDLINLTGAFQTSQAISIGVSAAVNVLDRNTLAIIGDLESSPTAADTAAGSSTYGSSTIPLGNITLSAKDTGTLARSAIAGSVESDVPPGSGGSPVGSLLGGTPPTGSVNDADSGIGASGAASLNLLAANNVEAYINDAGTFYAGLVSATANNATNIVSVTGAAAVTLTDKPTDGLAGAQREHDDRHNPSVHRRRHPLRGRTHPFRPAVRFLLRADRRRRGFRQRRSPGPGRRRRRQHDEQ